MNDSPRSSEKTVTLLVVLVLVVLVGAIAISSFKRRNMPKIDPDTYQAIFLDNNQQYFGHLKNLGTRYPYLTDIYYVQVQGPRTENLQDQKFTLIKLGNEIHGPEDVIYFNPKKLLFWENLKSDSKVVKGIAQEKAQRNNAAAVQPVPAPVAPLPAPGSR